MQTSELLQIINREHNLFPTAFTKFLNTCLDPELAAHNPDAVLEAFHLQLVPPMTDGIATTYEYRKTRNYFRSLSLILFTEIFEPDYNDLERAYYLALIDTLSLSHPDILHHKETRLIYPSNN